jgi:crotonobetainyl-CoA:carnitine CoA-transferase CaiB-like acyl-CoA transferase
MQPLEGLRVIDLSRILAGPYCSMILGDLGAEIIKIEKPDSGDDTRSWGPPFIKGESAYFICLNRNKKSLTLDLQAPKGVEILKKLVTISDVLIENFSPGTMERFGIGYDILKDLNPRLIYCSITGFGPDGPYRNKTGYDMVISAIGGLMSITGEEDGPPVKVGVAITDVITGIFAQGAIMTALYVRDRTGRGQKIDLSLLESQVASLVNAASSYLISGNIPKRWGTAHESIVPYQAFKAKDKYFTIGVGNDKLWIRFCNVIGRAELAEDPRFATNPLRVKNRKELIKILEEIFKEKVAEEWLTLLEKEAIPCGPINTIDEVFKDPQVLHREMLVEIEHPKAGLIKMVGIPVKYSDTKPAIRLPPPVLGEHTQEILQGLLGYSSREIQELRSQGVI